MNQKDLIRQTINAADMVCKSYVGDLSDDDLLHRPVDGINHINWQLGHLITAENMFGNEVKPDSMPALPDGFAEKYTKEAAVSDDASSFESKDTLLAVAGQQREGLLAVLDEISEEDLTTEAPEKFRSFFPNAAAMILSADTHWMMHAGQWAVIRRSLGKPPLF